MIDQSWQVIKKNSSQFLNAIMDSRKLVIMIAMVMIQPACKSTSLSSTPQAAITQIDGSLKDVDLSKYIAVKGECDLTGGYEIAASLSLPLGKSQFDDMKKTPWVNSKRGETKPIGSLVTEYEFGLLVAYSGGLYWDLNAFLRGDRDKLSNPLTDREWSIRSLCAASAINKLSNFQGPFDKLSVYRGAHLKKKYIDFYNPGTLISERAFQSYSRDFNVAFLYSAPADDDAEKEHVIFETNGSGHFGIDLEPISSFRGEKEVLINADHKFCVDSVTERKVGEFISNHAYKEKKIRYIKLSLTLNGKCDSK